jgi:hypothetical protein
LVSRISLLAAGIGLLLLGVAVGAACGDDDDSADAQDGVTQEQLDAVSASAQNGQILAVLDAYRIANIHDWNIEVNAASEITAGWDGTATRIRQATASLDWPEDLAEHAGELEQAATDVEDAIANEDLAATKTAVTATHEAWHHLEPLALSHIAGEAAPTDMEDMPAND